MPALHTTASFTDNRGGGCSLTSHASLRLRQRGIDVRVLECLLRHGREQHDHRGAVVVVFDRNALDRIRRYEGADMARAAAEARELYAVVGSDGRVLTTGHRFRRVVRDLSLSNLRPRRRGFVSHGGA